MYFGGKNGAGVYQTIINWIPPHKIYIEPFLGSGSILRQKKPAEKNIGIEIDSAVIEKFNYPSGTIIYNDDALERLKIFKQRGKFNKQIFIYADPPYPISSQRSSKEVYNYEMTDQQHVQLLKLLLSIPAMIAISTYKNPIYEIMLKGWNLITFPAQTRQGIATEYLYMNYSEPKTLHDYSFLGEDFTERQRIKRKIDRHVNKLMNLPILERNAIVNSIAEKML